MQYDPRFAAGRASALRVELQARSDMLDEARQDFSRQARHPERLEAALARWLLEFRQEFGDRFCTHAVLCALPLPQTPTGGATDARLRRRVALSRALRPATFRAISGLRDAPFCRSGLEDGLASRTHTRAYAIAQSEAFADAPQAAADAALREILSEGEASPMPGSASLEPVPLLRAAGL